ncbi:MAG: deoxyribonuclease V [Candidatus Thiodiazotropha sp.]
MPASHSDRAVITHSWDLTPGDARALQERLRSAVITTDDFDELHCVAGTDVGFEQSGRITRAAVAVLDYPALKLTEQAIAQRPTRFPYIPGLLSFREIPALLDALEQLRQPPDLLLCDGQGIAHPRRFGLACHLGVITGLATIGVAKSRLIGHHEPLGEVKGRWVPLWDGDERIGAVVRTRTGVQPLYVSVGHRVSLETAVDIVLACTGRYRLPETTRAAHRLASVDKQAVSQTIVSSG